MSYFKKLIARFPLTLEGWLAFAIALVAILYKFGIERGLLNFCVIISTISDGFVIVLARALLLNINISEDGRRNGKILLAIFIALSLVIHPITFYHLGIDSFELILPMLGLLVIIYLFSNCRIKNRK